MLPPVDLQNEFAEFVQQADKLKSELQKSIIELKNERENLVKKYFY